MNGKKKLTFPPHIYICNFAVSSNSWRGKFHSWSLTSLRQKFKKIQPKQFLTFFLATKVSSGLTTTIFGNLYIPWLYIFLVQCTYSFPTQTHILFAIEGVTVLIRSTTFGFTRCHVFSAHINRTKLQKIQFLKKNTGLLKRNFIHDLYYKLVIYDHK